LSEVLGSGAWYNRSRKILLAVALATGVGFFLFCAAAAYYVGQYFVCIDGCSSATPPVLLIAVSAFFGMIPAAGTGAIGYFIVKGLWDDARLKQDEEEEAAAATSGARTEHTVVARPN
jgi:hypothetical protein